MATSAPVLCAPPPGPPGSAAAFYSTDPQITAAMAQFSAGEFTQARQILQSIPGERRDRDELLEVIARTRREYSLDRVALLEKLRSSIPDATDDDITRWLADGSIQHRVIDGKVCIFRREPGHLLRFCPEAMRRRDAHQSAARSGKASDQVADSWNLQSHLRQVVEQALATGDDLVSPVRHQVTFAVTVKPNDRAKKGSILRVWLPFPQNYARQRDVKLLFSEPAGAVVAESAVDGDPVAGPAQRTVFFEQAVDDPSEPQVFRIKFEFTTSAFYPMLDESAAKTTVASVDSTYLHERPPHIVFTPELRSKVKEVVGEETNPLFKARKIFYFVDENLRWTPEEEYCVIPNLSMHGFARGKGDCGVASMLFISMCRIAGVPARWQSGWQTKPVGWNMHDWAEIYIEPWGWLPVDASNGRQKSDDPVIRDFYFGHTDSYRLIVNLDYGSELSPPKASFRSEPLDFQRGEVELDGKNLYFDEWDYSIEFQREPGP